MTRSVLFDDRGEEWDARSPSLAYALQASIGGEELLSYAVRNLGFVAVSEMRDSLHVRLRPAVVSPVAFSALGYYLQDRQPERILVSSLDREWAHNLFGSLAPAMRHLLKLLPNLDSSRAHDFVSQTRSVERIASSNPLGALLQLWHEAAGHIDRERVGRLLEEGVRGRYVIVQTGQNTSDVFLREVGRGFLSYDNQWLSRSQGLRVEDQPDYFYGRWVADAYRATISDGEPRVDDVDAIVDTPHVGRSRVQYTRLIVPIRGVHGARCLLGASLVDRDINLRVKAN